MKKVIFTAIAMIAFSTASMANTIAEEAPIFQDQDEMRKPNCAVIAGLEVSVAEMAHEAETGECFNSWVWNYIYLNALYNCENN